MTAELGIIEGYFGRAWHWDERKAVVDRLAGAGYRFYHYAPKIDAKLRRDWMQPYDDAECAALADFSAHCRGRGVAFGVGLTPYGAHADFAELAKAALKAKLAQLDAIGINHLAILFDDMRGDMPRLAATQAEIAGWAMAHSRAARFFLCPTYYSTDPLLDRVFGQRPARYLEDLGRMLDPSVHIFWTGEEVCSTEFRPGPLIDIADRVGRKLALWDNYPVNDGPRMSNFLHLRAFTGRPAGLASCISHHAINPASQPVLTCIPALTLPRSYALGDNYSYAAEFRRAAAETCGADLARMLEEDLAALQSVGRERLTAERAAALRGRYAAVDHPAAREVVGWLDGDYAITGEMLQTQ